MNEDPFAALDYPSFPTRLPGQGRVLIAFSGGPDSLCLAALACQHLPHERLLAIHVDHGQDADSGQRAMSAHDLAKQLGLDCRIIRVTLDHEGGPEAAARRARYRAFEQTLGANETLLMAHHADDQAETVMLRLLRGAGPAGLAGMPVARPLGRGWLYRPLLAWRREQILDELARRGLQGLDDPHNQNLDLDRNYLRQRILPALDQRWPAISQRLLRSARLCRQSAEELTRLAGQQNPSGLQRPPDWRRIPRDLLDSPFGLAEFIRAWARQSGLPLPPGPRLDEFVRQIGQQRPDRHPALHWDDHRLRHYRDQLWLDQANLRLPENWQLDWLPARPLSLPGGLGSLAVIGEAVRHLGPLRVRDGRPGDRLRSRAGGHARPVKTLMHEAGIPPWQRKAWPRLLDGERLLAVGDCWLNADFARQLAAHGSHLEWHNLATLQKPPKDIEHE